MTDPNGCQDSSASRTHGFKIPSPNPADPTNWSDDELSLYGLPIKPDKSRTPQLHDLWLRTFGRELYFLEYHAVPVKKGRLLEVTRTSTQTLPYVTAATRFPTSANWSGASLDAVSGNRFRQIWGQWTIPALRPPPNTPPPDCDSLEYQCSSWIGFDGQRLYTNSTLPQVGTLGILTVDAEGKQTVALQAWTQWWVRDDSDTLPVGIKDFPLTADDTVSAVLTVLDDYNVLCNLVNNDTSPPTVSAVGVTSPPVTSNNTAERQYPITGATAEWIMERPAVIGKTTLHAFPDYGTTSFTECYAAAAANSASPPVERTLLTPRYIRMFEISKNPNRTTFISIPNRIDNASFSLTYGDYWKNASARP